MKIAIVGNGEIKGNYGNRIDKHELVIRFNKAEIKDYQKKVGTKTNILSLVNETSLSYQGNAEKIDQSILQTCDYVIFSGKKRNEKYEAEILKAKSLASSNNKSSIVFVYIGFEFYYDKVNSIVDKPEFNKNPSTGINILCYILDKYDFSLKSGNKLSLYGFDSFKTKHYYDEEFRKNEEFHELKYERLILGSLMRYKNIRIYN